MTTTQQFARRAGHIAFGTMLIAGAGAIAAFVFRATPAGVHAWHVIAGAWLAALAAAGLAHRIAARVARPPARGGRIAEHVVPAVGLALVLPLTLHGLVMFGLGGTARDLDEWCQVAVMFTGAAHLALALLVGLRAAALAASRRALGLPTIYVVVVLVSAFPGLIWTMVPVAVTGVPMLALWRWLERRATYDEPDAPVLPLAIARI